jgi:hypothetical protein
MVHVSTGPPAIPDGGLSPGRCCPWPPDGRLPSAPAAEALTHLPPCALWCASTGAPWFPGPTMSGYSSSCQGPSAPLHEPGVPWLVVVSPTTSTGMTRLSALVRAHAPVLPPLAASGRASDRGSMQVAVSPCGEADLPDVVSAPPALRAWPPPPAALEGHGPVSSPTTAACPPCGPGRRSTMSVQRLPSGTLCEAAVMRACSGPQGGSPPRSLLALRYSTARQLWLLRPRCSWCMASPCLGYACRLPRAIDGRGLAPHKMRSLVGCSPNARPEPLPEAEVRHERRLLAVGCKPLIMYEAPSPAYPLVCSSRKR